MYKKLTCSMKRFLPFLFASLLVLVSCGTSKKAASGKPVEAMISFTTPAKEPVTVTVAGKDYELTTVKTKVWEVDRNIKKTPQNTIFLAPGSYDVRVVHNGSVVFDKVVQLGIREHKVIELFD